jgi:hypothetical protein
MHAGQFAGGAHVNIQDTRSRMRAAQNRRV